MLIGGFQRLSLIEYPHNLCCVVFAQGCNFRCGYCYNSQLTPLAPSSELIPEEEVFSFLERRKGRLDGVVVTGGEPTLQPDLFEFLERLKKMGFKAKLDTNGSCPEVIEGLLREGRLDYVAMDLKCPLDERYHRVAGVEVSLEALRRSMEILLAGRVDYEFRTTLVPGLIGEEEIREMAQEIKGARCYVLQQFVPKDARAPELRLRKPYTRSEGEALLKAVRPWVKEVKLRGRFE